MPRPPHSRGAETTPANTKPNSNDRSYLFRSIHSSSTPEYSVTAMTRRLDSLARGSLTVLPALLVLGAAAHAAAQQLPAFPGAQGFGATATGGRGGEVFHVTSLAAGSTGTYEGPNGYNRGTLRYCILSEVSSLPRTIVFDVGGSITLSSQITIENGNMTIAGQTAPGQGVSTYAKPWLIESGNNIVIRYIRNRLGRGNGVDSMGVEGGSNIIFDHVTSSWSVDEALSVAKSGTNVTVQNSLIYEGLNYSSHGYGSLIRPDVDSKVSYHHNLYANNLSRNPRPGSYNNKLLEFDFRNNVIYNWGDQAGYTGGASETATEYVNMNYVGNYLVAGPSTPAGQKSSTAFTMDASGFYNLATNSVVSSPRDYIALKTYQSGNLIDANHNGALDGADTGWGMFLAKGQGATNGSTVTGPYPDFNYGPNNTVPAKLNAAHSFPAVTTGTAAQAYDNVLDYAGSFWWNRDTADTRIVNQVRTQTGSIIVDQNAVGGFPVLPTVTRPDDWDVDHDGMPGAWEVKHGLNPNLSSDRNGDFDADGFTNLEEYLNEAGAWAAPTDISWIGGTGRYALHQNWSVWQPSRFDVVNIASGVATVDSVGQHAGTLRIAPGSGDAAQLKVTAGRLEVATELAVGTGSSLGTLTLAGGELHTPLLSKGSGGDFAFTGGVLHADRVAFPLVNSGGVIAPGAGIGETVVEGDVTLNSGVVEIEVGGKLPDQFDRLVASGVLTFGGTLRVKLVTLNNTPYAPALGDMIPVFSSAGTSGAFVDFDLPPLPAGLAWTLAPGNVATFLAVTQAWTGNPADFTRDGRVDAADLARLRANFGKVGQLDNAYGDANGDHVVNGADVLVWQQQLGNGAAAQVPEPTAVHLLAAGGLTIAARRRAAHPQ
jgi:pectate lyase